MYKEIFLDAPNLGEKEKKYLSMAIDAGFVSTVGPFVGEFEEKFASFLGTEKAVSTQSGTAALHMALYELGIGRGDEVIVPALTFIATVNPVLYVGARPVFADVDIRTWNIDPAAIEAKITRNTKAVIPVHLYGNPCRMDDISEIAGKHGIYVIEDATESLGALYKGQNTGTFGDLGCFSFNGNKTITTGGGGMIASADPGKIDHIKFLVNQAKDPFNPLYHPEIGFNYRMTNLEASLGLAQMEQLSGFVGKKRLFNRIYREELGGIAGAAFQEEYEGAESSFWMSALLLEKTDIEELQGRLKEKGIPTRRVFMPIVGFPPYGEYSAGEFKRSQEIYDSGLCLPSSTLNSADDIRRVCQVVKKSIDEVRR